MRQRVWVLVAAVAFTPALLLAFAVARSEAASGGEGTIVTVAGNGVGGSNGDGGPATAAEIDHPRGLAVFADGSFAFSEPFANTVRRVAKDGTITSIAGTGTAGDSGDGGPATSARLSGVHGVAAMPGGGFALGDMGNSRIRRVSPDGTIVTVAGTGEAGFSGDGGPATAAQVSRPRGLAVLADGGLLIPDTDNHRIRRVSPDGTITTVAGTGIPGSAGDGGPATAAQLNLPFAVAAMPGGGFLVADAGDDRIRRVWPNGTITTVAGTGVRGFAGDEGPATAAQLSSPHSVVGLPDGGFLIGDTFNDRVRRVWPNGTITTVAGTGQTGFSGDGGPATAAQLNQPKALAVLSNRSGFLIGDSSNDRVRLVRMNLRPPLELRIATPRVRSRAGRAATIRYTLSEPATTRLSVFRRGTIVLKRLSKNAAGRNAFVFGKALQSGTYRLRLVAITPDERTDNATASLVVAR